MRAQLIDKLQIAFREVQRAASIKDEMDAARQEELAAARERQLLNERLARNEEKEKQLMDRFDSLMDERRFDEALQVAAVVEDVDPDGVTPRVAKRVRTIAAKLLLAAGGSRRPLEGLFRHDVYDRNVGDSVPG